jgi:hypothetical protein
MEIKRKAIMMPKIKFEVNKEAEKEAVEYFVENRHSLQGKHAFDKYIKYFPKLEKTKELSNEEASDIISEFIEEYYKENGQELLKKKEEIEKNWNKISKEFFIAAEKLFDHKWPEGEYIAYLSIFGRYRFKQGTKEFYISYDDTGGWENAKGYINFTIIYQVMHIIVEDYYKTNFEDYLPDKKYDFLLSLVNYVLLGIPEIKKYSLWNSNTTPQRKEKAEHLTKLYKESNSMKDFFEKMIQYLYGIEDL